MRHARIIVFLLVIIFPAVSYAYSEGDIVSVTFEGDKRVYYAKVIDVKSHSASITIEFLHSESVYVISYSDNVVVRSTGMYKKGHKVTGIEIYKKSG